MKGATLIELMLALFISTLILSGLIEVYLATQSISQTQCALSTIMINSHIAFNFLRTDLKTGNENNIQSYYDIKIKAGSMGFTVQHLDSHKVNTYFVAKTMRINDRDEAIYALYQLDTEKHKRELVEGVNDMKIQYSILKNNKIIEINANEINKESKIIGMSIMLTFASLNEFSLQKNEFMYVSL